jgi:lysophospholipase L1-like esterase
MPDSPPPPPPPSSGTPPYPRPPSRQSTARWAAAHQQAASGSGGRRDGTAAGGRRDGTAAGGRRDGTAAAGRDRAASGRRPAKRAAAGRAGSGSAKGARSGNRSTGASQRSGPGGARQPADGAVRRALAGRPALRQRRESHQPTGGRVDRSLFKQPSGRPATAGRILGVGLLCFAIWTIFDANQLYHSALAGPEGVRRSAAITILRPIAAVSNALGLSGLVNWGDSALGRSNGTPGGYVTVPTPRVSIGQTASPGGEDPNGLSALPHLPGHGIKVTNTPTRPELPPLAQPTPSHPITILDIGDSIGEDLGLGLGDVFGTDPDVRIIQKGVESTGLARPDYYNWPAQLESQLRQFHPQAVVVMLGANDDQPLNQNGSFAPLGSAAWANAYKSRVQLIMEEALAAHARVVWVGLPPMNGTNVSSAFAKQVNRIFQSAASAFAGVTYVPSWNLLSNSKGGFTLYKTINGSVVQIRYPDGVHLAPAGYDLLAQSLVKPMQDAWHVDLHVR